MIKVKLIEEEDLNLIVEWNKDKTGEYLIQWAGNLYSYPLTINQVKYYYNKMLSSSNIFIYKILDDDDKMIGTLELKISDEGRTIGRVCRVLIGNEKYRGKGIGQQAIREILRIGFYNFKLRKITLGVFDFNKNAIKCYEHVGFKKFKFIENEYKVPTGTWSSYEMCINKEAFIFEN